MEKYKAIGIVALIAAIVIAALFIFEFDVLGAFDVHKEYIPTSFGGGTAANDIVEGLRMSKNLDVWFMLMLVAFLMIFIRKFEWGVALATLLSAAASFMAYLAIQDIYFDAIWDQYLLSRAVICSITLVIAIGVFLGTCKMWQYVMIGVGFAFVYSLVEWILGNVEFFGDLTTDPGGSILVHMCAAYFGLGVALGIQEKRAFDEPLYTTTHSVTFVWLASMLLWMLWPSFVTSLCGDIVDINIGTMTCLMAGVGSLISAYAVCVICEGKVNPLTYTYAMLCGPVAIGAPLLVVGPWGGLLIGLIAGAVSALCFIYLQPRFTKLIGVYDLMGVHNLHGMGGWIGAITVSLVVGSAASITMAVVAVIIMVVCGAVIGVVVRFTRGRMDEICTDQTDFIFNEDPAYAHIPVKKDEPEKEPEADKA